MQSNPVLRKLGLADDDRVAIIHTDDIGMCLPSVQAYADLWEFGLISSGAVMVPCPWFPKAAEYARQNPQADLGVHITLTSEWKTYRWGPVSTSDPCSGLIDEEGFFYPTTAQAQEHGEPDCVAQEIEAQVQRAIALGIQPTHIDTHMGTVASLKLIPVYLKAALSHRLPAMLPRMDEAGWRAHGVDTQTASLAVGIMGYLESLGLPLLDHLHGLDLDTPDGKLDEAKQAFSALQPGLTHFILHPSKDTPELREITPDWRARVADYETFMNEDLRKHIQTEGIQVIGYRSLQSLMPDPAVLNGLPF
jgi:chitin disaccharide deacetylase